MTEQTPFQKWYAANREQFNRERAARRKTDPEYRERQRRYKRKNGQPDPEMALTLAETARKIEVSIWSILGWRDKKLFPAPLLFKGVSWVHSYNLPLLKGLRDYLKSHPRTSDSNKGDLEDIVNWVHANWNPLEKPKNGTEET